MSSILLYHHLGLGDHFMCNGIVREYCKKYSKVGLFCYAHNAPSIAFMYKDLKNLVIIKGDDAFARNYILENASKFGAEKYDEVKIIGFQYLDRNSGMQLERQFHQMAGVDLEKKWTNFHVDRDLKAEKELFDKVAPKGDYAFIHEDPSRNYNIKRDMIGKDCALFIADKKYTPNVFDYCTIIEKAKEIHVIDSSFMFMIDCLPYHNPSQKLFVHRYSRENDEWKLPILKKNWRIITDEKAADKSCVKMLKTRFYQLKMQIQNHPFAKRIIRKCYSLAGKQMNMQTKVNMAPIIERYTTGKSVLDAGSLWQKEGAAGIAKAQPVETVVCSEILHHTQDPLDLVNKLRAATKSFLILYTPSIPEMSGIQNASIFYPFLSPEQRALWNRPLGSDKPAKGRYHPESGHANWYWGLTPSAIESMAKCAGFEVVEKHTFPFECCFVFRPIQK